MGQCCGFARERFTKYGRVAGGLPERGGRDWPLTFCHEQNVRWSEHLDDFEPRNRPSGSRVVTRAASS